MEQADTDRIAGRAGWWSRKTRLAWAGLYVRLLAVAALALLCVLAYAQTNWHTLHPTGSFPWVSCALLLLLAVLAEAYTIRVAPGMELSAGMLVFFLSGAIVGPLACWGIAVASQLSGLRRHELERTLCFAASFGLVSGGTSLAYWAVLSHIGGFEGSPAYAVAIVGLGAGLLCQMLNFAVGAPVVWLRRGIGLRRAWQESVEPFLPFDLFFMVISLGLISVYQLYLRENGGASSLYPTLIVALCLLPVGGLIYAFRGYGTQRELAKNNARLAHRNERLALQAVASQITALDLKDNYTARHSASVAQWATDIARYLGLGERDESLTHIAGLLHDVGKIGVPDEVLKSSTRLEPEKWFLIESHCEHGYRILRNIDQFGRLARVVLHHHEHYDGNGYPRALAGEDIPLISRIICVADSYSAMVSDRPYGPPLATEVAMAELEYKKGSQFDPNVVDSFLAVLREHDEDYRRGADVDFDMEVQQIRFLRDLPPTPNGAKVPVGVSFAPGEQLDTTQSHARSRT